MTRDPEPGALSEQERAVLAAIEADLLDNDPALGRRLGGPGPSDSRLWTGLVFLVLGLLITVVAVAVVAWVMAIVGVAGAGLGAGLVLDDLGRRKLRRDRPGQSPVR